MLFGVGRIIVAAGRETRSRFALIHPWPTVALVMNMKPVRSGLATGELGGDNQDLGAVPKGHRPQDPPTPVALIELRPLALAAPAVRVPTKRKLAANKLRIAAHAKLHGGTSCFAPLPDGNFSANLPRAAFLPTTKRRETMHPRRRQ